MSYLEKLKDPRWQRKRLEIMQRDNFTCQVCYTKELTLNIHHLSYRANPWESPNDQLTTLCEECHFIVEKIDPDHLAKAVAFAFRVEKNKDNRPKT
jgi:5-methylcytosine-specific restriction endonuclease McrA